VKRDKQRETTLLKTDPKKIQEKIHKIENIGTYSRTMYYPLCHALYLLLLLHLEVMQETHNSLPAKNNYLFYLFLFLFDYIFLSVDGNRGLG
jgi:hypothetical protein